MPVSIIFYFYSLNSFLGKDTPIALVFNIFINTYAVIIFGISTADISGGSLSPTLSFSCFEIGNLSNSPLSTCMWGHFWQLNWASGTCGVDVVSLGNHCCLVGINQGQTLDKQLTADTRSNLKTMEANGRGKKEVKQCRTEGNKIPIVPGRIFEGFSAWVSCWFWPFLFWFIPSFPHRF